MLFLRFLYVFMAKDKLVHSPTAATKRIAKKAATKKRMIKSLLFCFADELQLKDFFKHLVYVFCNA